MPIACIKAYIVVGPTKRQPRFCRSLDSAIDDGVLPSFDSVSQSWRVGRSEAGGSKRQK